MPTFGSISPDKLIRLVGTPGSPRIVDVRDQDALAVDPYIVPGSIRRDWSQVAFWSAEVGPSAVVLCQRVFDRHDADGNGFISREEATAYFEEMAASAS